LIGYLYGIGLGFDQEIPHHSTFSKNRHGRFQESRLPSERKLVEELRMHLAWRWFTVGQI